MQPAAIDPFGKYLTPDQFLVKLSALITPFLKLLIHGPKAKSCSPKLYDSGSWPIGAQGCPFGHYGMHIFAYVCTYIHLYIHLGATHDTGLREMPPLTHLANI